MCTRRTVHVPRSLLFLLLALFCVQTPSTAQAKKPAPDKGFVLKDAGFATPESVLYDPEADLYLVSNINGSPARKDGNGFISRVSPEGKVLALRWIDGRKEGVELHAPKGMALLGKGLFVADIDAVRVFDRATGKALRSIPVQGARFLNDLCAGPDGRVYATDTGAGAVFRLDPKTGKVDRPFRGKEPPQPNGITADDARIYVASFGGAEVWCLGREGKVEHRWKLPAQGLDGLVRLSDGTLLVSSWRASAVFRIAPDGTISKLFTKISAPADIGFDSKRKRVLIPWFNMNRVEARPLPGTATGGQTEEKIPAQKEGTAGKETVSLQPAPETRP